MYPPKSKTYTLAFLSFKTAQRIDLERIWKEQALTPALEREIIEVSKFVQSLIVNPPGGANVGEWCKKEKCWQSIRDHEYTLSDELQLELLSVARPTIGSQPATGSIDSLTDEELALIDEAAAIEKKQCIYLRDDVTDAQIIANLLSNPVKALIESGFFFYNEDSHVFSVSPDIWSTIDRSNKAAIMRICRQKLKDYYKD